jgi:hypothetical protein
MSPLTTTVLFCGTCREDSAFEQPECLDGHSTGCPEWVCVQCGEAVLLRFDPAGPELPAPAARRVA